MRLLPKTEIPDGLYVVYQVSGLSTVLTALTVTCTSGGDDAEVVQLRAKTLPMDDICPGDQVVLVDPATIIKIEQISEKRYHFLREQTIRRIQMQNIESAINLKKLVDLGKQQGLVHTDGPRSTQADEKGVEAAENAPSQGQKADGTTDGPQPIEAPFAPKTVPINPPDSAPPLQSRDDEVAEHDEESTLMQVPPPGQ